MQSNFKSSSKNIKLIKIHQSVMVVTVNEKQKVLIDWLLISKVTWKVKWYLVVGIEFKLSYKHCVTI